MICRRDGIKRSDQQYDNPWLVRYFNKLIEMTTYQGSNIFTYLLAALTGCITLTYLSRLLQGSMVGKGLQQIGIHSLTIFCIEIPFILIGKQLSEFLLPRMSFLQAAITTSFIQLIIALIGGYLLSNLLHRNEYIKKLVF